MIGFTKRNGAQWRIAGFQERNRNVISLKKKTLQIIVGPYYEIFLLLWVVQLIDRLRKARVTKIPKSWQRGVSSYVIPHTSKIILALTKSKT